jgi:hypothetical protein
MIVYFAGLAALLILLSALVSRFAANLFHLIWVAYFKNVS